MLLQGLLDDSPVGRAVDGDRGLLDGPAVLHEWREMLRAATTATSRASSSSRACAPACPVLMDNPREVGTDRIINALAAAQLYGGPAIVVDFGTATTFDVVSARGRVRRRRDRARASRSPSRRSAGAAPSCARSSCSGPAR